MPTNDKRPNALVRSGLEDTTAMLRAERDRAMGLVRRASTRIRDLHEQLARAEAALAMREDQPLAACHGQAANQASVQVAA